MEPNTPTTQTATSQNHGVGPLVGTLIVLAILVLGGVYFLSDTSRYEQSAPPVILGDNDVNAGLPPTSSSDDVNDISADIDATNVNEVETQIEADLQTIEANL